MLQTRRGAAAAQEVWCQPSRSSQLQTHLPSPTCRRSLKYSNACMALGQLRPRLLSSPNFCSHQSGFRTGHSTETALLDMLNVCFVHTVIYVCWLPMYHARENMHSLDGSHNLRYAYASRGKNRTPAINYNMTYLYQFTTYTNCFRYRERRYSVFN